MKKKKAQCPHCYDGEIKLLGDIYMCTHCKEPVDMDKEPMIY